jgi:DNA-cytosine methyltransferase
MKVLSLFDGISGCRQALKELNIDCQYYASEIDKYAIQVAKANHPDIVHIGDVKNLFKYHHFNDGRYNQFYNIGRGNFDLLIGGSPCQDLSIAKKDRKGLQGDRSSLFYEYVRILNEVKPKYFILENVASMSKESKEIITKELFNIEPIMINSALLTAQNRKRLYWVGKLINGEYKQVKIEQPKDQEIYLKDIIEEKVDKSEIIATQLGNSKNWGNAINKTVKAFTLRASQPNGVIINKPIRVGHFNTGGQGDRVYSVNGKSVCLSANGGGRGAKTGLYDIDKTVRKLTVNECCRLQGFPDGYCDSVSKTQSYKGLGNSFTVPVIKHLIQSI